MTDALPGWFGKLPGLGDFAHRRLPALFREPWDQWLSDGLAGLRERHLRDWTALYLDGPLWCFALGADTLGPQAWIGVLMPSVDDVGRYFPLTLARPFDAAFDAAGWWIRAAGVALTALDEDFDAERLEAAIALGFSAAEPLGNALPPQAGHSSWRIQPEGGDLAFEGLPRNEQFDALFSPSPKGGRSKS